MSGAAHSLRENARLRRHGKGIFGKDMASLYKRGDLTKNPLPKASESVRAQFAEKEKAYRIRQRWKWVLTIAIILLPIMTILVAVYFSDA